MLRTEVRAPGIAFWRIRLRECGVVLGSFLFFYRLLASEPAALSLALWEGRGFGGSLAPGPMSPATGGAVLLAVVWFGLGRGIGGSLGPGPVYLATGASNHLCHSWLMIYFGMRK